jgi:hypothetical protein
MYALLGRKVLKREREREREREGITDRKYKIMEGEASEDKHR